MTPALASAGSPFLMTPAATAAGGCFTLLLTMACVSDVRHFRIPNWLVAVLFSAGVLYTCIRPGLLGSNLLFSVEGLALGFILWLPFYVLRWIGAGDVKLFAAAGVWLGPMSTVNAALVAALVGGVISLIWMVRRYGVQGTAMNTAMTLSAPTHVSGWRSSTSGRVRLPYGIALSVGALTVAWFPHALPLVGHAR